MKENEKKYMKRRKVYRRCLLCALFLTCMTMAGVWLVYTYRQIPGNIKLKMGEEQVLDVRLPVTGEIMRTEESAANLQAVTVNGQGESNIPAGSIHIDLSGPVTMRAGTQSSYRMDLKLFGWIPFKQVDIEVIQDMTLTPVGLPIGIYLKTDGVLVIGIGDFKSFDGTGVSPSRYLLKTGDYILAVDGEAVTGKNAFIDTIEQCGGSPVVLSIRRGEEEFDVEVLPVLNQNAEYKLGIWVRDNAQGVGTMTFVDSEGNFGALGHGINDVDTSIVMELDSGTLYQTEIIAIKKGTRGDPGEMTGMIEYSDKNILGIVTDNTSNGIFGTCNEKMLSRIEEEAIPIGLKQEAEIGAARILCTVDGEPAYYDIQIKELHLDHANVNKGIVIKVTDPELIAITGGIVQGMFTSYNGSNNRKASKIKGFLVF